MPRKSRRAWKHFFYSNVFLALVVVAFVVVAVGLFRIYYENYQVDREIARLEEEARRLEGKRLETLQMLSYVQSPEFVEERARLHFNLVKPGESVGIRASPSSSSSAGESPVPIEGSSISNARKWWKIFIAS